MEATVPMTNRQRETLDFIREYFAEHNYAPTLREIGERFGTSSVAAFEIVDALISRRVLSRVPNAKRGLALADRCPCCGHDLTAG